MYAIKLPRPLRVLIVQCGGMFILERAILFIKQRPRPLHARVCTEDRARDLRESVSRAVLLKLSTVVTERNLSPPPLPLLNLTLLHVTKDILARPSGPRPLCLFCVCVSRSVPGAPRAPRRRRGRQPWWQSRGWSPTKKGRMETDRSRKACTGA